MRSLRPRAWRSVMKAFTSVSMWLRGISRICGLVCGAEMKRDSFPLIRFGVSSSELLLARPVRVERTTYGFEGSHSLNAVFGAKRAIYNCKTLLSFDESCTHCSQGVGAVKSPGDLGARQDLDGIGRGRLG